MKAAVLREVDRPLEVEDVELDRPGPREVLIRTGATGSWMKWASSEKGRAAGVICRMEGN